MFQYIMAGWWMAVSTAFIDNIILGKAESKPESKPKNSRHWALSHREIQSIIVVMADLDDIDKEIAIGRYYELQEVVLDYCEACECFAVGKKWNGKSHRELVESFPYLAWSARLVVETYANRKPLA